MRPLDPLPIDPLLPSIVTALAEGGAVVVEASPGAGKTTRVPRALFERGDGEIVVLEPRRLAARMAAARVASELGQRVGESVGYQVRFDARVSARTRVRFVTEGVLLRQLATDPVLSLVRTVVIDELHERHLQCDLALALIDRLRRGARPDLELVAMSATLDAAPVVELYGAALVRCEVQRFDVATTHLASPSAEPLDLQVACAVRALCRAGLDGHVLVFLPGVAEIRRAADRCRALGRDEDLTIMPLHGALPAAEQDAVLAPSARRKLILATNVAETSLTIDGVAAVIDSGLCKVAVQRPWSTLPALQLRHVSRASATQRAGRAGRTRDGRCVRLYTARELERQPAYDEPEIARSDLCEARLATYMAGASDADLRWLSAPDPRAIAAADDLLVALGALQGDAISERGRSMARMPLHPRLSAALLAAAHVHVGAAACDALAVVAERSASRSVDLWQRVDELERARAVRFDRDLLRSWDIDASAARACDRLAQQLARIAARLPGRGAHARGGNPGAGDHDALLLALCRGFPDRVAKRSGGAGALALADGQRALVHDAALLAGNDYALVFDASQGRASEPARVRLLTPLSSDHVLEAFADTIEERSELCFNGAKGRVERRRVLQLGALVIEDRREAASGSEATAILIDEIGRRGGFDAIGGDGLARLRARVRRARLQDASLPSLDDAALARKCDGMVAIDEVRATIADLAAAEIGGEAREQLARLAPDRILLAGGSALEVHYPDDAPPWVASYLQDFFGMREGPRAAGEPLVLHLWAPNGRPVQVTSDLTSFWDNHYPKLRRQLSRRYPKHHWPDDPTTAKAARLLRHL